MLDTDAGAVPVKGAAVAVLADRLLDVVERRGAADPLGNFAAEDVLSGLAAEEAADMRLLLDLLERAGLVSDGTSVRPRLPGYSAVRQARIAVVGSASWATRLRVGLAEAGFDVVAASSACELLLVAADAGDPEAHRRYAREARARAIPVLHGSIGHGKMVVGPLFRPGLSACWNCARNRSIANDLHPAASYRLDRERSARPLAQEEAGLAGRIAADLLALETMKTLGGSDVLLGRVFVFHLATLVAATHWVIALPECEVCGGAAAIADSARYRLDLSTIDNATSPMTDLPGWVDAATGVITAAWVEDMGGESGEGGGPYFARAQPASLVAAELPTATELCSGKGLTRAEALRSALGEALERYAAGQVPHARIILAAVSELDGEVLAPGVLGIYSDEQYEKPDFPFERFDTRRRYHWIAGTWLPGGGAVWLPAEMAMFAARPLGDRLCQVTTSGLALGCDADDAAMRAVLELVERDAAMMTWLCRLPGRHLVPDRADPAVDVVARWLDPLDVRMSFHLLDVGVPVPTVLACSFGDGVRWPGLCVGSAAHPSARLALRGAVLEMTATGRSLVRSRDRAIEGDAIQSDQFGDHALYYVDPARARAAEFLRNETRVSFADLPEVVMEGAAELATLLAGAGIRIAIVDVTPPDVALSGLRAVRAFSDGLLPIHCGTGFARLGASRLANRGPFNADPHPFC